MGKPNHLWAGNWERESAAHGDELARHRAELADREPAEIAGPEAPLADSAASESRRGPRTRVALLIGLGALVVAGVAIALFGSGSSKPKLASRPPAATTPHAPTLTIPSFPQQPAIPQQQPPVTTTQAPPPTTTQPTQVMPPALTADARWLGVTFSMLPQGGVTIDTVTRGGAADAAGIEPGDQLSQLDGRPISTFDDVLRAFAGVHPGSQIEIVVDRGSAIFTTSFPMPARPRTGP
jgi:membrane-associated protease RseP (regulator of RpoE activity)